MMGDFHDGESAVDPLQRRMASPWCVRQVSSASFDTLGLSVYSGLGAESLHPLCPLTYLVSYGVMDDAGDIDVRLVYDHRVVDGAVVARALAAMELVLHGEILRELESLEPREAASAEAHEVESAVIISLPAIESSVAASSLGAR